MPSVAKFGAVPSYTMNLQELIMLIWNVRGLNDPDRHTAVNETPAASSCHIACLQESKLQSIDAATAAFVGGYRLKGFAQRPAAGTRGGILVLWDESFIRVSDITLGDYCISLTVTLTHDDSSFRLTSVYGPTKSNRKEAFFAELLAHKPPAGVRWVANGDFNQIYRARDKNKRPSSRSRINRFRETLQLCELHEVHLQNRRFTWSNGRANPTLSKLDYVFCNYEWDVDCGNHILHALSSSLSDHCPLLLAGAVGPRRPRSFKFENFWVKMPGFHEVVNEAWSEPCPHSEPCHVLFHKLKKLGCRLRKWSSSFMSQSKLHLHMALEIILRLDVAQDNRALSPDEVDLHKSLKRRIVSLAVLERSRMQQRARFKNLKEGDANTKFFHNKVNGRRRKNYIHKLSNGQGWVTDHDGKQVLVKNHFSQVLGRGSPSSKDFIWEALRFPVCDLSSLGDAFTEEEVLSAIKSMPSDKAPGPDGYTGAFFKACWPTIKTDVMRAIQQFSDLHSGSFHWLNSANIVLLPKRRASRRSLTIAPSASYTPLPSLLPG